MDQPVLWSENDGDYRQCVLYLLISFKFEMGKHVAKKEGCTFPLDFLALLFGQAFTQRVQAGNLATFQ